MQDTPRVIVRSFLFASLLGSKCYAGHFLNKRKITWQWIDENQAIIEWKAWFVRRNLKKQCLIESYQTASAGEGNGTIFTFNASSDKGRLRIYRKWLSNPDGSKRIGQKIRFFDHPMGLLIWLIDHGVIDQSDPLHPVLKITLYPFEDEEMTLLEKTINTNFNFQAKAIRLDSCYIQFVFEGSDLVQYVELIKPFVPRVIPIINQFTELERVALKELSIAAV